MEKDLKQIKDELQFIISTESGAGEKNLIKAAQTYLRRGKTASKMVKADEYQRSQEEESLISFIGGKNLWFTDNPGVYITEGAEQKVFFSPGTGYVIKFSDAFFYQLWVDYFNNLLLHNYFFPDTAYQLIGFSKTENKMYAVVKQQYITATEKTSTVEVKKFLDGIGFLNKKNDDYYHPYLGLILEDLHDENVLTTEGIICFIDTVFYLTDKFYEK